MTKLYSELPVEQGNKCYRHPKKVATHNIVTEVDSFGYESTHMCNKCYNHIKRSRDRIVLNDCDLCHAKDVEVTSVQDPEEGAGGCTYDACSECARKIALLSESEKQTLEDSGIDYAVINNEVTEMKSKYRFRLKSNKQIKHSDLIEEHARVVTMLLKAIAIGIKAQFDIGIITPEQVPAKVIEAMVAFGFSLTELEHEGNYFDVFCDEYNKLFVKPK